MDLDITKAAHNNRSELKSNDYLYCAIAGTCHNS
jgi:hypothetical protein